MPYIKDSTLGKGYSYLFALVLTFLLASNSIYFSIRFDDKKVSIAVSSREISAYIFYPSVFLIAGILGLPTDGLANLIAKILKGAK